MRNVRLHILLADIVNCKTWFIYNALVSMNLGRKICLSNVVIFVLRHEMMLMRLSHNLIPLQVTTNACSRMLTSVNWLVIQLLHIHKCAFHEWQQSVDCSYSVFVIVLKCHQHMTKRQSHHCVTSLVMHSHVWHWRNTICPRKSISK